MCRTAVQHKIQTLVLSPLPLEGIYIKQRYPHMYKAATALYGSWAKALQESGLTPERRRIRQRFWTYVLKKYNTGAHKKNQKEEWLFELHEYLLIGGRCELPEDVLKENLLRLYGSEEQMWRTYENWFAVPTLEWYEEEVSIWKVMRHLDEEMAYIFDE